MAQPDRLESIRFEGALSVRRMGLGLRPLNILIGANGAGKSNLLKLFRFVGKLVHQDLQLHVRQIGGADAVLHFGRKVSNCLSFTLRYSKASYICKLVPTQKGELVFEGERIDIGSIGSPVGVRRLATAGSNESELRWSWRSHRDWRYRIYNHIDSWRQYHFDDTSEAAPVKQTHRGSAAAPLESDAANLAAVLYHLQHHRLDDYRRIVDTVRRVFPPFHDFELKPELGTTDLIRLRWRHRGLDAPFDVSQLSDGTLRFISLATLLLHPVLPALIILDEPELGLHPYAIQLLAGMMRSAAARSQIVVATQSATLASQFQPEDLIIVETKDDATQFRRLAAANLEGWLEDYRLGDLWEKNVLGGAPV
ncbi:MAG: AAA family ATPase [Thiohalocapsa sp. PB-PSB1]|jgi:predicted ATPase|nr:MAG: hypothetical protein N838_20095 [Thiohalocapsa sp. PB-PSB1]QQO52974.1 MAG: AAA family ATPase [Thiohalocapsa sp. PB-PSB1]HCS91024.1 hypothetical protein [Chromatiaceae bacterium]